MPEINSDDGPDFAEYIDDACDSNNRARVMISVSFSKQEVLDSIHSDVPISQLVKKRICDLIDREFDATHIETAP